MFSRPIVSRSKNTCTNVIVHYHNRNNFFKPDVNELELADAQYIPHNIYKIMPKAMKVAFTFEEAMSY